MGNPENLELFEIDIPNIVHSRSLAYNPGGALGPGHLGSHSDTFRRPQMLLIWSIHPLYLLTQKAQQAKSYGAPEEV